MDNRQLLNNMIKKHKETLLLLQRLEDDTFFCNTEAASKKDVDNYNKRLKKANDNCKTLLASYKMIAGQKISLPNDFYDLGNDINDLKVRAEKLKPIQ